MKYATGEDPAHQRYVLDTEIEAAQNDLTRTDGIGAMSRERYVALRDFLLQYAASRSGSTSMPPSPTGS